LSELSSVTVVWSVISAAAFLLGLMHFSRWVVDRSSRVDVTFSLVAFAFVAVAIAELHTMYARSPAEWGALVKVTHLPLAALIVGTVVFVRQYLGTGRSWLAGLVIMLRVLILAINAGADVNFNFERIDTLARIEFLGETISTVGEAVTGRWQFLATVSNLLLVAFILDATISLWKRGGAEDRRRAGELAVVQHFEVLLAKIGAVSALRTRHQRIDRDHVDVRAKLRGRGNSQNKRNEDEGACLHGIPAGLRQWTHISFHPVYAAAPTITAMNRRDFLADLARLSFLCAGIPNGWRVLPMPRAAGDPFMLGVASGDPTSSGVVIWTRLAPKPLDRRFESTRRRRFRSGAAAANRSSRPPQDRSD